MIWCNGITNGVLYLPNLREIGRFAFADIYHSDASKDWSLPISNVITKAVTGISDSAFCDNCFIGDAVITNLTDTAINNNTFLRSRVSSIDISSKTVTQIGDYAFITPVKRLRLDFPNLETIGRSAFSGCGATNDISDITLDVVRKIYDSAFYNSNFTGDLVLTNMTELYINNSVFCYSKFDSITISNGNCSAIYQNAFANSSAKTMRLDLPKCTVIQSSAFSGCSATNDISFVLPKTVTKMGGDAYAGSGFRGTADLSNVDEMTFSAFDGSAIDEVILGENWTSFSSYAGFEGCPNLKKVTFPQWDLDVVPTKIPIKYKKNYTPFKKCTAI